MADQDTLPPKVEKYLFDQHNFDEGIEDEPEEELPPPPPTFSEEELAAAKKEAFEKGKAEGLKEASESREQAVSALLKNVAAEFSALQKSEADRAQRFETEAVALSRTVFETLFPVLNENAGLDEVENIIRTALEAQRDKPEITIFVHEDYVKDIEETAKTLVQTTGSNANITVETDASLGQSDCRIQWDEGGARRDIGAICEQIETHFEQALADRPRLGDNGKERHKTSAARKTTDKTPPEADNPGQERDASEQPKTSQPDNNGDTP